MSILRSLTLKIYFEKINVCIHFLRSFLCISLLSLAHWHCSIFVLFVCAAMCKTCIVMYSVFSLQSAISCWNECFWSDRFERVERCWSVRVSVCLLYSLLSLRHKSSFVVQCISLECSTVQPIHLVLLSCVSVSIIIFCFYFINCKWFLF